MPPQTRYSGQRRTQTCRMALRSFSERRAPRGRSRSRQRRASPRAYLTPPATEGRRKGATTVGAPSRAEVAPRVKRVGGSQRPIAPRASATSANAVSTATRFGWTSATRRDAPRPPGGRAEPTILMVGRLPKSRSDPVSAHAEKASPEARLGAFRDGAPYKNDSGIPGF